MITTVVTGGQTGADQAAFDTALAWGVAVRGWVPRGRAAEDGVIPDAYPNLRETASDDPAERTRLNVRDSNGSLIVSHGPLHGGSLLALEAARALGRPVLHADLTRLTLPEAVAAAADWVRAHGVRALGVGGPRASDEPRVYSATVMLLSGLFGRILAGTGVPDDGPAPPSRRPS